MTISQGNIGCLVVNVSLGAKGKIFQDRIEELLNKNGVEWTNNRLKAIWNAALLLRNGEGEKARSLYRENSISYRKDTLIPKGPEGIAVQQFVTAQRPSVLKRKAAVLRYYCSLKLENTTQKQLTKALNAIGEPYQGRWSAISLRIDGTSNVRDSMNERKRHFKSLSECPLREGEIHGEHLHSTSKYYSRFKVPKELRGEPYSSMVMSFLTEPWLPEELDRMVPCFEMREAIRHDFCKDFPQQYAGKITFLQEQGCKARVVAQPSAWLQLAFRPLHARLADIADELFPQESCVRNQQSGAYAVLQHLSEGKSCYCTDLSSATDRFPREYSIGVLKGLGYNEYAEALERVCQHPFVYSVNPNNEDPGVPHVNGEIRYSVGQPMGLYGSFPLFHLSNMLVADAAVRYERLMHPDSMVPFRDGTFFRTVGDDIVFSDKGVAERYRSRMGDYGVRISDAKSFQGTVAEFAGFIGLKTNESATVFRPYKVPNKGLTNGIQFLDAMGSKLKKLSPYWARTLETYESTKSSRDIALEPLIPGDNFSETLKSANRGDNHTVKNLANAIYMCSQDRLPDHSVLAAINSNPLFRERRMFDFYGYNPVELIKAEDEIKSAFEPFRKQIHKDPLMQESRDLQSGRQETPTRLSVSAGKALAAKRLVQPEPMAANEPTVSKRLVPVKELPYGEGTDPRPVTPLEDTNKPRMGGSASVNTSDEKVPPRRKAYSPEVLGVLRQAEEIAQRSESKDHNLDLSW